MTLTVSERIAQFESLSLPSSTMKKKSFDKDLFNLTFSTLLNNKNTVVRKRDNVIIYLDIRKVPFVGDLEIQALVTHCPQIQELFFESKRVTDRGVAELACLNSLQVLSLGYDLEYAPLKNNYASGLQKISSLPSLKTLDLTGCHYLSPNTFNYLHAFKQLETLRFPLMSKISAKALEQLELSLPYTTISFGQLSPNRISLY
jgi:hypothetical protein